MSKANEEVKSLQKEKNELVEKNLVLEKVNQELEQKEKELLREIKQQCKIGLAAGTITKSDLLNKIRELIAQKGPGVPAPNEVSRLRIKSKKLTT